MPDTIYYYTTDMVRGQRASGFGCIVLLKVEAASSRFIVKSKKRGRMPRLLYLDIGKNLIRARARIVFQCMLVHSISIWIVCTIVSLQFPRSEIAATMH